MDSNFRPSSPPSLVKKAKEELLDICSSLKSRYSYPGYKILVTHLPEDQQEDNHSEALKKDSSSPPSLVMIAKEELLDNCSSLKSGYTYPGY